MTAIVLIRPLYKGDESEFQEPLGIERLAGFLRANGFGEVFLYDRRLYEQERRLGVAPEGTAGFWDDLKRDFPQSTPPAVIGFSVMTAEDVPDTLKMISRMTTSYPQAHFIVGGLFITTSFAYALKRFPSSVQLIAHEGELPLLRAIKSIVAATDSGQAEHRVPTADTEPSQLPSLQPDEWAFAYRPDLERYLALGCAINLQSSRGCYGTCTFCATPSLPAPYQKWQPRSISLVVDEIEVLAGRAAKAGLLPAFNIVDDSFGALQRVEELDVELCRRKLHIAYALQLRIHSLSGQPQLVERLKKLKQGGFTRVFIGVESLCPHTLQSWTKPYDLTKLPAIFSALKDAGISAHIGYILWHKESTIQDARTQAQELKELGLYCPKIADSRMVLFPGSQLHAQAEDASFARQSAYWEPMCKESEVFYHQLAHNLAPVYRVWKEGAILSPWLVAQAHLNSDYSQVESLDAVMDECNQLSFEGFVHDVFPEGLQEIADKLMQRVLEIKKAALLL